MAEIGLEVKKKCVELAQGGTTSRAIYKDYFAPIHPTMSYETFRRRLKVWKKKEFADTKTLETGTYPGFIAHGATVQVSGDGQIVQAWIKQHADDNQIMELVDFIRENTTPMFIDGRPADSDREMLEIPLFDQHFPISDHRETLLELRQLIKTRKWESIYVIIGQDMFHNDDFRGRTSSGRPIEKVDMVSAWDMARNFYANLITGCLEHSADVRIVYSKGNHDESMAWAFVQMLKEMFPQVFVDDALDQRKLIYWRDCFIGITHGAYKKSSKNDLRGQFTIQYPIEFARSTVREIHVGHLHREDAGDVYGVMCRRLSRNGVEDEWSDDEGLVGSAKRFMVFRWKPGRLAGIDYV